MPTASKTLSNENQSQAITDAGAPFNHAKADVILRSSDNVDFRVFKLFLSLASPVFGDMFSMLQGPEGDELKNGLPVVQMTEGRKTLEMLLLICYPMSAVDPPDLKTLDEVNLVLEVATKYDMERVVKKAREWLVATRFLDVDPVRVFAVACHHRLREEAKLAAAATTSMPLVNRPYGAELELITGGQLDQLLQYHENSAKEVQKILTDFTWIEQTSFGWFQCRFCPITSGLPFKVDRWWSNYMKEVWEAWRNRSWDEATNCDLIYKALKQSGSNCGGEEGRAQRDMEVFRGILKAKIKEVLLKVSLRAKLEVIPYLQLLLIASVGPPFLVLEANRKRKIVPVYNIY
jgi:hypothetical protein